MHNYLYYIYRIECIIICVGKNLKILPPQKNYPKKNTVPIHRKQKLTLPPKMLNYPPINKIPQPKKIKRKTSNFFLQKIPPSKKLSPPPKKKKLAPPNKGHPSMCRRFYPCKQR